MFEIIPSWSEPAGSCSTVLLPPARDPSASDATVKPVGLAGLVCPEDNPGGTCAAGLAGAGSGGSKGKPPGSGTTGEGWGGERDEAAVDQEDGCGARVPRLVDEHLVDREVDDVQHVPEVLDAWMDTW